ncbi:MAG TPA: hypothetical protein VL201_03640 [Patescibacteria group bacterium]|jgi:hypothetical protein|nr:hypothetical protein [Patescibacteria group bacterium]
MIQPIYNGTNIKEEDAKKIIEAIQSGAIDLNIPCLSTKKQRRLP